MAYKTQRCKVLKAFRIDGEDVGQESIVDLPLPYAIELRNARRLEFAEAGDKLVRKPLAAKVKGAGAPDRMEQVLKALEQLTAVVQSLAGKKGAQTNA